MSKAAQFHWAQIAGANPEPVEVIDVDGRAGVLTIGCSDPFWLDEGQVRVHRSNIPRPSSVYTKEEQAEAEKNYDPTRRHGWRGAR